jgi:tripartite-type tricarboxylate transporter receptor subunit TctC
LLLATPGMLPIPAALQVQLPYDVTKDFTPITQVALTPIVLVAHPGVPAKNFAELAAMLKGAPPNTHFYGTWGAGSVGHFAGELLRTRANLQMTHVPYKGSGPLVNDLIAGHVKIGFLEAPTAAPLVQSGKLRALALASPERTPSMPEVPTLSEVGVAYRASAWYGVVGPKNIPADVLARLNTELRKILSSEEIRKKIAALGMSASSSTPAEFRQIIADDVETWSGVARVSGMKAN